METRGGRLSVTQLRRLGATARRRGHPIYENPYLGDSADAWREGWEGASDGSRSPLRSGSFMAELYHYLVRCDRDDGLTQREITDGLVERGLVKVGSGLNHLHKKGLVRRLLPKIVGQRRMPQRYRAVPRQPGAGE